MGCPSHAKAGEERIECDDKGPVADAVDDEGLVARAGVLEIGVPEADQRERTEADALPSDEHQPEVVAKHQHEHREGEQVKPSEEAPVGLVVVHVANRVDVDQAADAGDNQHHHHRERVEPESNIEVEAANVEPAPEVVEHEALVGSKREHQGEGAYGEGEAGDDGTASDDADGALAEFLLQYGPCEEIDCGAGQRQQNYPVRQTAG